MLPGADPLRPLIQRARPAHLERREPSVEAGVARGWDGCERVVRFLIVVGSGRLLRLPFLQDRGHVGTASCGRTSPRDGSNTPAITVSGDSARAGNGRNTSGMGAKESPTASATVSATRGHTRKADPTAARRPVAEPPATGSAPRQAGRSSAGLSSSGEGGWSPAGAWSPTHRTSIAGSFNFLQQSQSAGPVELKCLGQNFNSCHEIRLCWLVELPCRAGRHPQNA